VEVRIQRQDSTEIQEERKSDEEHQKLPVYDSINQD
jgi:hypothetical protein